MSFRATVFLIGIQTCGFYRYVKDLLDVNKRLSSTLQKIEQVQKETEYFPNGQPVAVNAKVKSALLNTRPRSLSSAVDYGGQSDVTFVDFGKHTPSKPKGRRVTIDDAVYVHRPLTTRRMDSDGEDDGNVALDDAKNPSKVKTDRTPLHGDDKSVSRTSSSDETISRQTVAVLEQARKAKAEAESLMSTLEAGTTVSVAADSIVTRPPTLAELSVGMNDDGVRHRDGGSPNRQDGAIGVSAVSSPGSPPDDGRGGDLFRPTVSERVFRCLSVPE